MIRKAFVTVGGGNVHYRIAGAGPAVVLLHDSPRSSRLHLATMAALASRFTVIALDTPGYGNSSPLDLAAPRIEDFAEALAETLTALGLDRPALYATHTSAKIALECVVRHPDSASLLILDGLSIPQGPPDEAFIARYMQPFVCDPMGGYLASEWTRIRDMGRWFPWFARSATSRIAIDTPPIAERHAFSLDYFMAGPDYASAYAAAMRYQPFDRVRALKTPCVIMARADDVLFGHLDKLPADMPGCCTVERLPADRDIWLARIETLLLAHPGSTRPAAAGVPPVSGPSYIDLPHGQVMVDRLGKTSERPLVFLGELPGGVTAHLPFAEMLAASRPVIAIDLPGSGESDPLPDPSATAYIETIAACLSALSVTEIDMLAEATATPLAIAFAAACPAMVAHLILDRPLLADEGARAELAGRYCPAIVPVEDGSHVVRTWHMLRDQQIQSPWYDGSAKTARPGEPDLDPMRLHQRLLDVLKQIDHYGDPVQAALAIDAPGLLERLDLPVLQIADGPNEAERTALVIDFLNP